MCCSGRVVQVFFLAPLRLCRAFQLSRFPLSTSPPCFNERGQRSMTRSGSAVHCVAGAPPLWGWASPCLGSPLRTQWTEARRDLWPFPGSLRKLTLWALYRSAEDVWICNNFENQKKAGRNTYNGKSWKSAGIVSKQSHESTFLGFNRWNESRVLESSSPDPNYPTLSLTVFGYSVWFLIQLACLGFFLRALLLLPVFK